MFPCTGATGLLQGIFPALSFFLYLSLFFFGLYLPPRVGQGTALSAACPRPRVGTNEYPGLAIRTLTAEQHGEVNTTPIDRKALSSVGCETYCNCELPRACRRCALMAQ